MIVEKDNIIQRISVKSTTRKTKYDIPILELKSTGGNKSRNYSKPYDKNSCDLIFVYVKETGLWLIPSKEINCISGVNLGTKFDSYKIEIKI